MSFRIEDSCDYIHSTTRGAGQIQKQEQILRAGKASIFQAAPKSATRVHYVLELKSILKTQSPKKVDLNEFLGMPGSLLVLCDTRHGWTDAKFRVRTNPMNPDATDRRSRFIVMV